MTDTPNLNPPTPPPCYVHPKGSCDACGRETGPIVEIPFKWPRLAGEDQAPPCVGLCQECLGDCAIAIAEFYRSERQRPTIV